MLKRLFLFLFIFVLLTACNGITLEANSVPAETLTPWTATTTDTPVPFPTSTPTNTQPPQEPVVSGFPYAAILSDTLPKENLVLGRHFYADTVGHMQGDEYCYDVGIYADNTYIVISCLPDFTYPAPNGTLDANQTNFLNRWVEKFRSFDEPSIHGLLTFTGRGSTLPEYADQVSMQALISDLEWAAHEYVHQGGYPTVVSHAREVLSHQLNKWLDNSAILHFEVADFPDSCLGVPKPNEVCEQVVTHGFRIQFVVDGLLYEYHTDVFGYDIRPFGEPQVAPTQGAVG